MTAVPTIDPLPELPTFPAGPGLPDQPAVFIPEFLAFLNSLRTFGDQANALAAYLDGTVAFPGGVDTGAVGPGVVLGLDFDKRLTSAVNDDTATGLDYRNFVVSTQISGNKGAYEVVGLHLTPNFYHDGAGAIPPPNITFAYGLKQACRIGLNGGLDGTITTFRGIETHAAIEGSNVVTDLFNINVGDFDWLVGTGTAGNLVGIRCGNLTGDGGAARVTTLSACVLITEQSGGAPLTAGIHSSISAGADKYFLYTAGSAPSVHSGKMRVGANSPSPSDTMEVVGFLKASSNWNPLTTGTYHELQNSNSGQTAVISNSHATTPQGLRILFNGASPNNQTQTFLLCDDATTTRAAIYSDGSFKTKGSIGYLTGAGGAVTQTTSRTTGVTRNTICGAITLVSAAGSAAWQSFTVTNSQVAATDVVIVSQKSGTDLYQIFVTNVAAGSFKISFATTGGTTTEQPVFNFAIIKAVAS